MASAKTQPARGMRDFLPEDVRRREYVIGVITNVYERYGFEPLETPAVENIETLMGKYGEEGNQLIFKILQRGLTEIAPGSRPQDLTDLALRYDLTVPLARVSRSIATSCQSFQALSDSAGVAPIARAAAFASSTSATLMCSVRSRRWLSQRFAVRRASPEK